MYPALRTGTYRTPEAVSGLPACPRGGNLVARSDHDRSDAAPVQTAVDAAVARSGSPTGAHETLRGPRCVRLGQSLAAVKTMWNDRLAIVPVVVRETHATGWPRPSTIRGLTRNGASEPQRRKGPVNEWPLTCVGIDAHKAELHAVGCTRRLGPGGDGAVWRVRNEAVAAERLRRTLEHVAADAVACYEAGPVATHYTDRPRCATQAGRPGKRPTAATPGRWQGWTGQSIDGGADTDAGRGSGAGPGTVLVMTRTRIVSGAGGPSQVTTPAGRAGWRLQASRKLACLYHGQRSARAPLRLDARQRVALRVAPADSRLSSTGPAKLSRD